MRPVERVIVSMSVRLLVVTFAVLRFIVEPVNGVLTYPTVPRPRILDVICVLK